MEVESVVNGANVQETNASEKILKPRKPKTKLVSSDDSVTQNGDNESTSVTVVTESNEFENGHGEATTYKQNGNETLLDENAQELKENTTRKLSKESKKESTPKPEPPIKRELRRRETTPRESTPKKKSVLTVSNDKSNNNLTEVTEPQINEDITKHKVDNNKNETQEPNEPDESIIILEDTREEEIVSINESEDGNKEAGEKHTSMYSVFKKSYKSKLSADVKDYVEASTSSPSIICLDTPSYNSYTFMNKEIKGRKPINSCSKFPGRTVSIISLDSSAKRKADDDSIDNPVKKRFAGDVESGSENSPGWRFFSTSWSPANTTPNRPQSSTPFRKRTESDSMTVNYNEDTNLSLVVSDVKESSSPKKEPGKWCNIM